MNKLNVRYLLCCLVASTLLVAACGNEPEPSKPVSTTAPPANTAPAISTGPLVVEKVVDVRFSKDPETGASVIVGSIHGTGLRPGDMVAINNNSTYGTAFGNETWITFSMPASAVTQNSFNLEVLRPATNERSKVFSVNVRG